MPIPTLSSIPAPLDGEFPRVRGHWSSWETPVLGNASLVPLRAVSLCGVPSLPRPGVTRGDLLPQPSPLQRQSSLLFSRSQISLFPPDHPHSEQMEPLHKRAEGFWHISARLGSASQETKQQLRSGGFSPPCSAPGVEDEDFPGGR